MVRSTNDLSSSFSTSIDDIIKTGYGDSTADLTAGKAVKSSLSKTFDDLNTKLDKANNNLKSTNDGILAEFDAFSMPSTTQAGEQIREVTYAGYKAWDETQRTIYEEIGKFFEIPNPKVGEGLESMGFASKGGLGIQAKFIDASPLKEYVDILTSNVLDTANKLDPAKAGAQLADFQSLINKTGQKLSLKELLELRSGLASANRITEAGAEFASLGSSQRSDMLTIIDKTLARLESGEGFAAESLQSFFTKNLSDSQKAVETTIPNKIAELEDLKLAELRQINSPKGSEGYVRATKLLNLQTEGFKKSVKELTDKLGDANNPKTLEGMLYQNTQQVRRAEKDFEFRAVDTYREEGSKILTEIRNVEDQINKLMTSGSFTSPSKLINQLELDAAYHQKVIADINNNNKIDIGKIEAQIDSIKIANKFYSSGMQSFDQNIVKKIMFDALAGGHDVDKILTNIVFKNNNGDQLKRFLDTLDVDTSAFQKARVKGSGRVDRSKAPVRSTLELDERARGILAEADIDIKNPAFQNSEEVRGVLQREFLRGIVNKTQRSGAPTNYRQIANAIEGYGTTPTELFGATKRNELIRTLRQADDLMDVGTSADLNKLLTKTNNVDQVINDLAAKIAAQEQLTELGTIEVFKKIQNGNIDAENIVNSLFKAGNSEDIVKVKQLLGPDSTEFKQFQQSAMRKILSDYIKPGDDVVEQLFTEGKFYDAMFSPSGYGEAVLKETFGETQFKALREAAKRSKFAVGGERASSGGGLFTQGLLFKIIFQPLQSLPQFGALRLMAAALGRPNFVKWLSGGTSNKAFMQNELPSLYDGIKMNLQNTPFTRGVLPSLDVTLPFGQPTRRAIGTQVPTEVIREGVEYGSQRAENEFVDPKAPIAVTPLELPEVENLSAQGGQAPMNRSLLGGNPANEEIFDRRYNNINQDLQRLA